MICSIDEFNAISPHMKRPLVIDSTDNGLITCHLATNEEMCRLKTEAVKKKMNHPFKLTLVDETTGFDWLKAKNVHLPELVRGILDKNKIFIIKEYRGLAGAGLAEAKEIVDRNTTKWFDECCRFRDMIEDHGVTIERAIELIQGNDSDDDDTVINKFTLNT